MGGGGDILWKDVVFDMFDVASHVARLSRFGSVLGKLQ